MKIAVCDDNQIDRDLIKDLLRKYMSEKHITEVITEYENGMNLVYDIADGGYYDLVFLDIYMEESNGMDIARKLRSAGYTGKIVFLTSTAEFAVDSYEVEAVGYLLKPHDYSKLCSMLDRIIGKTSTEQFHFSFRNTIHSIPFNEIMYVESCNNICILHRSDCKEFTVHKKLNEIEEQLNDSRFLRCHQSYLVNMNYIAKADKQFELITGDVVLIRQRSQKQIRTTYQKFLSETIVKESEVMTLKTFFEKTNGNYNEVISRLINEKLIMKYLKKFLDDGHFQQLKKSVEEQDFETAYRSAHTLKGLCLSLGFETMRKPVTELTEELRAGKTENAEVYITAIEPMYADIIRWIGELS